MCWYLVHFVAYCIRQPPSLLVHSRFIQRGIFLKKCTMTSFLKMTSFHMSCQFRRHFTMCLSTTSLAILLLLDFKPSTVPGKDCSWGASAYFAKSGPDKKFIRLGEVNIGVSLSMTGRSCHELRYVGTEQLSQVWLTDCFQPHQIATFSDMWYAAVSVDWQRPNSERVLTHPNLSETICRRQLPARFANDFSPNGKHHAKPSATSTPLTRSTSRGYIRAD